MTQGDIQFPPSRCNAQHQCVICFALNYLFFRRHLKLLHHIDKSMANLKQEISNSTSNLNIVAAFTTKLSCYEKFFKNYGRIYVQLVGGCCSHVGNFYSKSHQPTLMNYFYFQNYSGFFPELILTLIFDSFGFSC